MQTDPPKQEDRDGLAEDRQRLAQVRSLMEIAAGQGLWSVTAFTGSLAAARDFKALMVKYGRLDFLADVAAMNGNGPLGETAGGED